MSDTAAPRFRLASSVDLTKADPACLRCGGRGVAEVRRVDVPGHGPADVPVICRCVSRARGVAPDLFDKVLTETQRRLDDGSFAAALVHDVNLLPPDRRPRALAQLEQQRARSDLDPTVRSALEQALEQLRGPAAPEVQA